RPQTRPERTQMTEVTGSNGETEQQRRAEKWAARQPAGEAGPARTVDARRKHERTTSDRPCASATRPRSAAPLAGPARPAASELRSFLRCSVSLLNSVPSVRSVRSAT